MSTSSTERTGDRRWDVTGAVATNPDLARLRRLHTHLVDTTPMTASTPLTGIGTSSGARFVTLWARPRRRPASRCARAQADGRPVPAHPGHRRGRRPGDRAPARRDRRLDDGRQRAVADVQQAAARASAVSLPASVAGQRPEIIDQVAAVLAVHQFTAEFAPQVQAFFDRHLG